MGISLALGSGFLTSAAKAAAAAANCLPASSKRARAFPRCWLDSAGFASAWAREQRSQAAIAQAGVVKHVRMLGQVLVAGQLIELFQGGVVIAFRPFHKRQGQAVTGLGNVLVAGKALQEVAEARDGEGIVLVVVSSASTVQQHAGLVGSRLDLELRQADPAEQADQEQPERGQGNQPVRRCGGHFGGPPWWEQSRK